MKDIAPPTGKQNLLPKNAENADSAPLFCLSRQKLVYGRDIENELLWLQHTYLVIVAKAIAARVLGFEVDDPADLLSGRRFAAMGVSGAVESDFFDWVLENAKGRDLIVRLARHRAPRTMTIFRRIDRRRGATVILAHSLS
jgi:hypothetical protein